MELFVLSGTIAIEAEKAKQEIDKIIASANQLAGQLGITSEKAEKTVGKDSKLGAGAVWLGNTFTAATNFVGRALLKLPGMATEAASEVNARMAAFSATFGELSDTASATYQSVSEETNILESRLQSVGTKGYSQLKGAGLDATDALAESERVMRMAADAAAYYNISLEDADTRIRSFMRGNTEAGDAIGLFTSESQRNMYALDAYGQKYIELTEAQKQLLMLDITQDIYKANGVIGQAARESMEYANVTANAAEAGTLSLATFGTQINNSLIPALHNLTNWLMDDATQSKLNEFAGTLGNVASFTFDAATSFFDWIATNGEAVGVALKVIATGLALGAIAAHPYAAAIMAVAAGLAYLNSEEGKRRQRYDHFFDGYSDEELQTLQAYVDAVNAARAAEEAYFDSGFDEDIGKQWDAALEKQEQAFNAANAIEGLIADYHAWRSGQAANQGKDLYLDVPLRVADGAEAEIQGEVDGMSLEALVRLVPDASQLSALGSIASGSYSTFKWSANGSHADGLDYVPFDNYRAILHRGEAVLTASEARDWRGGQSNGEMASLVAAAVRDAVAGIQFNVSLDGGALVGQLAPTIDRHLGTLASRKGRG